MDDEQRIHLESLRQAHQRRLRILEQQAAASGANTRPEILTEIEDLQASITQIAAQLAPIVEAPSAPVATLVRQIAPEQRRTQATILSAALVGASALFAILDPEDAAEIVGALWKRLDVVMIEYGGVVERRTDDTMLAVWGAQATREDDPERAIRAALAMHAALTEFRATQPQALALRIGISTGLVLISALGVAGAPTPVGSAATLAGQLQESAPSDGILIAHDTYRHVRGRFAVEPRSGTAELSQAYLVTAAKPRAFFLGSPDIEGIETHMIGRDAELARLQEAFQIAVEDNALQAVTIVGEAGVGKSWLLHAFRSWEDLHAQQAWLLAGRALPGLASQPFALLRDIFAFRFAIQDNDTPAVARDKLECGFASDLGVGDTDAAMEAHIIGQLLGFDFAASPHLRSLRDAPKQLHAQALHYLSQFVGALTRTRPLLLVLEDLHWADDTWLDALVALLRSCRAMPILALCLTRPALFERRPAWGEGVEGQAMLHLEALSKHASRQLVEEILCRASNVPAALREQIMSVSEGNPFYIEELIKMLIDEGAIVAGPDVWRVEAARLEALHVPPTLTGVLQARLDGLQPAERESLERASVIGRVFWDRAVAQLGHGDAPEQIGALLDGLRRRGLVFRHELSAFAGASEYLFTHMLLREVTYERVLKRQRRAYHAQAAAWLIAESGARADEYAALIAEHYERADDLVQATEWHERAGRQAQAAYANAEAIAHYERVVAALPEARRGRVLLALGQVLELIGQKEAAEERYLAALALAEAAQDGATQRQCQQALGLLLRYHGDYRAGKIWLDAARATALAHDDRAGEATALRGLGRVAHDQGDYTQARALYAESLALFRTLEDTLGIASLVHSLGLIAHDTGNYGQARALFEESLMLKRQMRDKQGIARTLSHLGRLAHDQGDYAQARALHEQSLALFRAMGDKEGVAHALGDLGLLAHTQGDYGQARALYAESLALYRALGNKHDTVASLYSLGLLAHTQGDYTQARALYAESLALYRALGNKGDIAYALAAQTALDLVTEQRERVVRLAGATDALLQALGIVLEQPERGLYDTAVNAARAQLAVATFDALWAEGQTMTLEKAIDYALSQDVGPTERSPHVG